METDHKPLALLLMIKHLDELSPRLKRFRTHLLEYDYTMSHSPGNKLHTADVLSWKPSEKLVDKSNERNLKTAVCEFEEITPCFKSNARQNQGKHAD